MENVQQEQLDKRSPTASWQVVQVTFTEASADLVIPHRLETPDPEQITYQVLRQTGPAVVYHDGSPDRIPWGKGYVRLQCNQAPIQADILLTISAVPIQTRPLPAAIYTPQPTDADTLDGLDSSAFSQNAFKTVTVAGQSDIVADSPTDTLEVEAGTGITLTTNAGTDKLTIASSVTASDSFKTIVVSGQSDVVADAATDTLTLVAGTNITLTTDASTDSVTIASSGGTSKIVQIVNTQTGAVATGTTVIPFDNTIPQNTEGNEYMTFAITPTSATNKLKIDVVLFATSNAANWVTAALFQDSTANALAAISSYENVGGGNGPIMLSHYMTAGTTSATTFKVRAGRDASAGTTVTFNGQSGGRIFGGVMASSITITEILV